MRSDLLEIHLKLLVLDYGREQVIRTLAHLTDASESELKSRLDSLTKTKAGKQMRARASPDDLLSRVQLSPTARQHVSTLVHEFLNKRFLGERRLVEKFLREHNARFVGKSRLDGLPKVIEILAKLSENEIAELIDDCTDSTTRSGYANLADAIMGQKTTDQNVAKKTNPAMATKRQVTCINKREHQNAHERIQNIGGVENGVRWKIGETAAITAIEAETYQFYVSVKGKAVDVVVATHNGRKYLKTTADGYAPNNLLSLPECP
jgi:hypothetical protein